MRSARMCRHQARALADETAARPACRPARVHAVGRAAGRAAGRGIRMRRPRGAHGASACAARRSARRCGVLCAVPRVAHGQRSVRPLRVADTALPAYVPPAAAAAAAATAAAAPYSRGQDGAADSPRTAGTRGDASIPVPPSRRSPAALAVPRAAPRARALTAACWHLQAARPPAGIRACRLGSAGRKHPSALVAPAGQPGLHPSARQKLLGPMVDTSAPGPIVDHRPNWLKGPPQPPPLPPRSARRRGRPGRYRRARPCPPAPASSAVPSGRNRAPLPSEQT